MRVSGIKYIQGRNSYSVSQKYGIAIHNTSNDASSADEASYATRRTDGVSTHFYADDTEVIQSLDTANRAGHAGSSNGNYNAVAVEITGVNAKTRDWWISNVNWKELGRVLAEVCKFYGIAVRRATVAEMKSNPKVKAFYSHNDMRLAWGGTTHTDPGDNFPWDVLFASVNQAMGVSPVTPAPITWGENMAMIAQDDVTGILYVCDGITSRQITAAEFTDIKYVASQGLFNLAKGPGNNSEWSSEGYVRKGWKAKVFGAVLPAPVDVSGINSKLDALSAKLDALVIPTPEQNVIKLTVDGASVSVS